MRERIRQWRRARADRRVLQAVRAGRRRAVLVYSMGKVGSTAVVHALQTAPDLAVFHVHHLAAVPARGAGHRRALSALLWRELVAPGVPAAVITLTREPIARNVSAFFQNLRREVGGPAPWQAPTATLVETFLTRFDHTRAVRWFDDEPRRALGVDVYAAPFDAAAGHARIAHDRYPTLVLRCELDDAAKGRLIGAFLGRAGVELARANAGEDKAYAHAYAAFRRALRVPQALAGMLLESRYARHFHTPAELAAARTRWQAPQA